MDQERFDRITRTLATGQSRRRVLGLLSGGLAVAFGGGARSSLASYAGCATYTAEYYRRYRGNAELLGTATLGPTNASGSSSTSLGTYAKSGELDVSSNGVVSDWTGGDC